MRRLIPYLIIAALLTGSVVAYAAFGGAGLRGDSPAAKAQGKSSRHPLVQGHVEGLYPGSTQRMGVVVQNDYARSIILRRVRVIARRRRTRMHS